MGLLRGGFCGYVLVDQMIGDGNGRDDRLDGCQESVELRDHALPITSYIFSVLGKEVVEISS